MLSCEKHDDSVVTSGFSLLLVNFIDNPHLDASLGALLRNLDPRALQVLFT